MRLQVKTLRTWNELEAIRPVWERILQGAEALTIFSTLEWLGAWWKAFAKDKELVTPVFSNADGEIVAVVPLYADCAESALPFRVRRLRLVGDGSEDACAQAFLSWLESNPHWDICELNTLPLDSASLPSLISDLKRRRWTLRRLERPRSRIPLPDTWESYLKQSLSKKEKTKIGYYTNRLMKRFRVSIAKCDETQALPASLATLFALHQKRWQLKGRPGAFASAPRCEL